MQFTRYFILLLLALGFPTVGVADEKFRAVFLRDYKPDPGYPGALDRGFAFTYRMTDFHDKGKSVVEGEGVMSKNGYYLKELPTNSLPFVDLGNDDYMTFLSATKKNDFVITSFFPEKKAKKDRRPWLCLLCGPFCETKLNLPFVEAVRDPTVTVEKYADTTWRDKHVKVLRLTFQSTLPQSDEPIKWRNDYFFAPEADWLCIGVRERSTVKLDEAVYGESAYTFSEDRDLWSFVPKTIECVSVDERQGIHKVWRVYDVTTLTPRRVSPEEVRLTHFGLPEPTESPAQPTRSWLWLYLLGAAILLFGVAILFRRLHRRSLASKAQPS